MIIQGDALTTLKTLPDSSVNCVVTSPPYYGLRDYGVAGQIGLEDSVQDYIEKLSLVFSEIRRVLKSDGTLWLNLGDSYAKAGTSGLGKKGTSSTLGGGENSAYAPVKKNIPTGLKPKDLIGIPWRVAFRLQEDGWYLRQDIIWSKPNPMPESVTDRCTKSHEYIYLLTKSAIYYFDSKSIKEPLAESSVKRLQQNIESQTGTTRAYGKTNGNFKAVGDLVNGRNKRSVWTVTTKPFKEAHFATFPQDLIEPCILAGCPVGGTVLDPFIGAGTTGLVAKKHGRNYIGIELNHEYIKIAEKRLLHG
jgi:DNA modification methylase